MPFPPKSSSDVTGVTYYRVLANDRTNGLTIGSVVAVYSDGGDSGAVVLSRHGTLVPGNSTNASTFASALVSAGVLQELADAE
jgi:hypothetical protein